MFLEDPRWALVPHHADPGSGAHLESEHIPVVLGLQALGERMVPGPFAILASSSLFAVAVGARALALERLAITLALSRTLLCLLLTLCCGAQALALQVLGVPRTLPRLLALPLYSWQWHAAVARTPHQKLPAIMPAAGNGPVPSLLSAVVVQALVW